MTAIRSPRWKIFLPRERAGAEAVDFADIPGVRTVDTARGYVFTGGIGSVSCAALFAIKTRTPLEWTTPLVAPPSWESLRPALNEIREFVFENEYLWAWQKSAVAEAAFSSGWFFWHPPGAGKTLSAILRACVLSNPVIVVVPAKVRIQWDKAVRRFSKVIPFVVKPENQRRKRDLSLDDYLSFCKSENRRPFIIGGLEALKSWGEDVAKRIAGEFGSYGLIYDEIHRIRSDARWEAIHYPEPIDAAARAELEQMVSARGGKLKVNVSPEGVTDYVGIFPAGTRAKTAEDMSRGAAWRLGITGTRVWNAPKDLWGQLDLVFPGEFGSKGTTFKRGFAHRYCDGKPGPYGGIEKKGFTNQEELHLRLLGIAHRVDDSVLKSALPSARREMYYIPREELQRPASGFKSKMKEAQRTRNRSAELWLQLAEAATQKRPVALELIEERIGLNHKIVVFTGTREDCDGLSQYLRKNLPENLDIWSAHGGHPQGAREGLREAYAKHLGPCVLVGTWDAWGEATDGLQCTDLFISMMLPWCPGVFIQGEGRFNRGGQDRPVLLVYLVAEGTADERVISKLLPKAEAMRSLGISEFKEVEKMFVSPSAISDFAEDVFASIPDDVEFEDD